MSNVGRRYTDADLPRVFALLVACRQAGYVDMELLSTSLRMALSNPGFDRRFTLLVEAGDRLLAFAILWQGRYLGMLVDPGARGRIEPEIFGWAEQLIDPAVGRLIVLCRDDDRLMISLCKDSGFSIDDEELRMARPLDLPLPVAPVPAGFVIRPRQGQAELEAWLALYREAFGPRTESLRKWRAARADSDYQPALDLVAIDAAGRLAGCCYCSIAAVEAAADRRIDGRTEPIAVGRDYQRKGLGRALIVAGLSALRERGAQTASLTTEVDNHDAHRLYVSLGYQELYRARWYGRDLPTSADERLHDR